MKKIFLVFFLLSFPLFAQDNAKKSVQEQAIDTSINKTQEVDEKDTKKKKEKKPRPEWTIPAPPTDTVNFAVTTSLLAGSYFKGSPGLISQLAFEFIGLCDRGKGGMFVKWSFDIPVIDAKPYIVLSGYSIQAAIGYSKWVYKNLNEEKKGWLVGLNIAALSQIYTHYDNLSDSSFGMGLTFNMRTIYQLNRNIGFIIGFDFNFLHNTVNNDYKNHIYTLTSGITTGIAF
ncbi:MAG: hypothetical protein ACRCS8_01190 [Brevinema sp.]